MLCARAGLAEISWLASMLLHEHCHKFLNDPFHCNDLNGDAFYCWPYTVEFSLQASLIAKYGLPLPHHEDWTSNTIRPADPNRFAKEEVPWDDEGSGTDQIDGTEQVNEWQTWICTRNQLPESLCHDYWEGETASCGDLTMTCTHSAFWATERNVEMNYEIPSQCSAVGAIHGFSNWGTA